MAESQTNQEIKITSEEKLKIITTFHTDLKGIDLKKETIEKISNYIQEQISKYGEQIVFEIFQIIESESQITPRLEYLYLINDIIDKYKEINQSQMNKIFSYIKNICSYSYTTLNDNLTNKVKDLISLWEKKEIFNKNKINELKFDLKMKLEPEISDNKEEINYLMNLYNNGNIKFDQNLINFSKELYALDKNKDNKNRRNLLKLEKDINNK